MILASYNPKKIDRKETLASFLYIWGADCRNDSWVQTQLLVDCSKYSQGTPPFYIKKYVYKQLQENRT